MRRMLFGLGLATVFLLTSPVSLGQQVAVVEVENVRPRPRDAAEKRLEQLAARADAVLRILFNMEERLRRDGLALRSDLLQRRYRLERSMDEAEARLKKDQLAEARKAMNRAEAAVEYLERQLGGK